MNLSINITLSDEDIREGVTAQNVVDMLFPYIHQPVDPAIVEQDFPVYEEPEVEVQEEEGETVQEEAVSINNEQPVTVNEEVTEPAPGSLPPRDDDPETQELDSAGVPWDSEIHSSGRSKYKSGADKGRWVWKRASDPEERERIAQVLKEEVERSRPKSGGDTNGQPSTPATPPGPAAAAPVVPVPRPDNTPAAPVPVAPVPENSGATTTETVTPGATLASPVTWKALLNALDEHGIEATTTADALQAIGVDQIALLAPDDAHEQRDALARQLGLL